MERMAQLSVIVMMIDLLFGITIGIVLSASWASLREDRCRSLFRVAPDAICAGIRVLNGLYTADDGYLQYLLSRDGMARWRPGLPASHGKNAGR